MVKAFLDVGLYESMAWARWGATKWVQNEPRAVADNSYDDGVPLPPSFMNEVSFETFWKIIRPAFTEQATPAHMDAIFKRGACLVNSKEHLYYRPAGINKDPVVRRISMPICEYLTEEGKQVYGRFKDGEKDMPECFEEEIQKEQEWIEMIMKNILKRRKATKQDKEQEERLVAIRQGLFGDRPAADYLAFYLADLLTFYLAYLLTFYLASLLTFYLAYLLTFYLTFYLTLYLAFYLAFYLADFLTFYLANLLTFYLAYLLTCPRRAESCRLKSGEAHSAPNLAGWSPARPTAVRPSPVQVRRGPQRSDSRRLKSGEARSAQTLADSHNLSATFFSNSHRPIFLLIVRHQKPCLPLGLGLLGARLLQGLRPQAYQQVSSLWPSGLAFLVAQGFLPKHQVLWQTPGKQGSPSPGSPSRLGLWPGFSRLLHLPASFFQEWLVEVRWGPQRSDPRRLKSGEDHCYQELADEIRRGSLRSKAGRRSPARPTAIKSWQMRSGEEEEGRGRTRKDEEN